MSLHSACEYCSGPAGFVTEVAPLGSEPGQRVYYCAACKRHTWKSWRIMQQDQPPQE